MISKNAMVRNLVAAGDYKEALIICKDWNYENTEHRSILSRGYECILYPEFYRQIGYNPPDEYEKAVSLLKTLYT